MDLSHRMVKNFWAMLSMSGKLDFPHLSELNNSGVRVSVRQSNEPGQPCGMVVSAASSLWLPRSCEDLLNFFRDEKTRSQVYLYQEHDFFHQNQCILKTVQNIKISVLLSQWDVLSSGNPVHEIAHISCGTHPGNCISIIQVITFLLFFTVFMGLVTCPQSSPWQDVVDQIIFYLTDA